MYVFPLNKLRSTGGEGASEIENVGADGISRPIQGAYKPDTASSASTSNAETATATATTTESTQNNNKFDVDMST